MIVTLKNAERMVMQRGKDNGNDAVLEDTNESDEEVTSEASAIMENEEIS